MVHTIVSARHEPWFSATLLVAISAVSSLAFACITPFAAFAVAAAYALPARWALGTVAAVWLVNQAIGFTLLGYPWTLDTVLWGLAIGAAALIAAAIACAMMRFGNWNMIAVLGVALVAAFAAYEVGLYMVTFRLGGEETFRPAIVGHLAWLNLVWTAALVGVLEMLRRVGAIDLRAAGSI